MYAQPATFLVQIGLVELLKFFRIVPDAVSGLGSRRFAVSKHFTIGWC
jgi:hypothetical protein